LSEKKGLKQREKSKESGGGKRGIRWEENNRNVKGGGF